MHRERVSTKVTVQNTVYRSFLDGHLFGNDPDVFLLRDENISLSKDQRRVLITIDALFGSLLMTSDNIADYDEEKRAQLANARNLFEKAQVLSYARKANLITIEYELDGRVTRLRYDTERGVFV